MALTNYRWGMACLLAHAIAFPTLGQVSIDIVGVEEDWELVLDEPDPLKASPQIITWMSPTATLDHEHFGVDFNHVQRPDFISGGFQVKAMIGEDSYENRFSENGDNFDHTGEVITWTQRMLLNDGRLYFEVTNGTSISWGSFGGGGTRVSLAANGLNHLNNYSPARSAEWSGVGFAANRVTSLRLKAVRVYTADGKVTTSPVNIQVH